MKKLKYGFSVFLLSLVLSGCTVNTMASTALREPPEMLNRTWLVGGVLYTGHVVDINDVPDVKDMYHDGSLEFKDGTAYLGIGEFFAPAHILPSPVAHADMLLQSDFSEIDSSETTPLSQHIDGSYLITILDKDTLLLDEYFEDRHKKDELPIIFVKKGFESQYIQDHKGQPFHQPTANMK